MRITVHSDPFQLEPSTAEYVPRRATVQAFGQLLAAIERDEPLVLLLGPAGIGKTLLLRLLRRRVAGRMSCVDLDAAGETCDALCAEALRALGREPDGASVESLARAAGEHGRGGVLLLIDRAESLAPEALQSLLDLATRCPSLQIALAAELPQGDHPWLRSPDPRIAMVELIEPMSRRETLEYLLARLDLAVAPPEVRKHFEWSSWPSLIRESQGNPARLHHLARRRLDGENAGELPPRFARHASSSRPRSPRWRWLALGASALAVLIALALLAVDVRVPEPRPAPSEPSASSGEPSDAVALQRSDPEAAEPVAEQVPASQPPAAAEPPVVAEQEPPAYAEPPPPAAPLPAVEAAGPTSSEEPERNQRRAVARPETPRSARVEPELAEGAVPGKSRPAPEPMLREATRLAPRAPGDPNPDSLGVADELERAPAPPAPPVVSSVPVFVNAVPAARIEIDGRDVGSTPIIGLRVPPGTRSFVASFSDGRRLERTVDVEGDEVYVLFP